MPLTFNFRMTKMKLLSLVIAIGLILIHRVDSSNVYYVTPSPASQCPGEPCLTLSTLAANSTSSSIYFDSNITLIFLEGSHTLDSELVVSDMDRFVMLSIPGNGPGTAAVIQCSGEGRLEISHITQLQISGLKFIGCSSRVEFVAKV